METQCPHAADAVARGQIGPDHLATLHKFLTKLPSHITTAVRNDLERLLVDHAATQTPEEFATFADKLVTLIDQDGAEPDYRTQQRRRTLTVGRQQADGMSRIEGWLDPKPAPSSTWSWPNTPPPAPTCPTTTP